MCVRKQMTPIYQPDTIRTFTTHIQVHVHMWIYVNMFLFCVFNKLRNFWRCVQVSDSFSINSISCSKHLQDELSLVKILQKNEENRVFLYTSLVSSGKNRHISRWFWFSPSHDPKIYWLWRYGLLLVWLIWHWWTHPSVIHPIPSNFYIPLLEIPPVLLLFEPVWIFTISWPIDKTRPAKLSQDLLPANLLVVGSCCSSEPTLKWNDHS